MHIILSSFCNKCEFNSKTKKLKKLIRKFEMWNQSVRKCCQMLSLPFKKKNQSEKEYHNLDSERKTAIVQSPPKNSDYFNDAASSSRSSSTKATDFDKEFSLEDTNINEKLNNEIEANTTLHLKKKEIIELTTINIENPFEKYYIMASETIEILQRKIKDELIDYDKVYEDTKNSHNLKIFIKSYVVDKKTRISLIRSEWIAPCAPEKLLEVMNDLDEQKRIANTTMDQFYSYENFGELKNFHLMYLRYKKMLTTSPRDFVYLKCSSLIDKAKNIWIDCTKSIADDRFPEIKGETVRGDIILSGSYIESVEIEGVKFSKVFSYSEIDFKLNLPLILTKPTTIAEFRKYVDRTCQIIETGSFK